MFQQTKIIHPDYCPATNVHVWVSKKTGMQLILINAQTSAVHGYFTFATEINNNSGCPHTLEHLIFTGSLKYPFAGTLDTLGNKQMSNTNAWTGQVETVYTLSTAGWQGFQTMLPVYLDHVLYPTLRDAACMTEVFYIDGQGNENGVVFSEMEAIENTPESLIESAMQKLLYSPNSGLSVNTGGLLDSLRVLENNQIRQYHSKIYKPNNLAVIITGDVDPQELVKVMDRFEQDLDVPKPMPRPFIDSEIVDGPLKENRQAHILFPESDESLGDVRISWIGPPSLNNLDNVAIQILESYLTLPHAGLFERCLINVDDPLATEIYIYQDNYLYTSVNLYVSGVPVEKLESVESTIFELLSAQVLNPENIDMGLFRTCIRQKRDKFVLEAESDPATFAYMAIDAFICGEKDGTTLESWIADLKTFESLEQWSSTDWAAFTMKHLIKNCHATVIAEPSQDMFDQLVADREKRAKTIQTTMDLGALQTKLDNAIAENSNLVVPHDVLNTFGVPDITGIKFIESRSGGTWPPNRMQYDEELQTTLEKDSDNIKLCINFEALKTSFIGIKVYMSSRPIDEDLLPLVDLVYPEIFSFPMYLDDGTLLSHEQVIDQTCEELLDKSICTNAMLQEQIMMDVLVSKENYKRAILWIARAMFSVKFTEERLSVIIDKHLRGLTDLKRDGAGVLRASINNHTLSTRSLRRQSDPLNTEEYVASLVGNYDKVLADLERLKKQLFSADNLRIIVFGDIEALENPVKSWGLLQDKFDSYCLDSRQLVKVARSVDVKSSLGMDLKRTAVVTRCPASESCFFSIVSKGITDLNDEDIPKLMVINSYLGVTEGPLWKEVRGGGFAYGARIYHMSDCAQMVCNFYRAGSPVEAYKVTKQMVSDLSEGKTSFEDELVQNAKLALAGALALDQSTYTAAIIQKYFDGVLRDRHPDYIRRLIEKIRSVTKEEMHYALNKYVVPLFDPDSSVAFVVLHPRSADEVSVFLKEQGFTVSLETVESYDDEDDDDDEEDEENDDDEDDDDDE